MANITFATPENWEKVQSFGCATQRFAGGWGDPAVYENEERFNKEIVPQIEAQIVARVGYEAAHAVIETSEYILDQNGAYHDNTMSLVDRAIQAKANEYILAKRSISKREHSDAPVGLIIPLSAPAAPAGCSTVSGSSPHSRNGGSRSA